MSQTIPPPPYRQSIQDRNGYLTQVWAQWFQVVWERMGGSKALSNLELGGTQTGTGAGSIAALQAEIAALQAKIDQTASQVLALNSNVKVADATGHWQTLVGNALTLSAGRWMLHGMIQFDNDGTSPVYTQVSAMWGSDNGADSNTVPDPLYQASNLSVLSAVKPSGPMSLTQPETVIGDLEYLQLPAVIVSVRAGMFSTVYLNSFCKFTGTASHTEITAYLNATMLRSTP